MESLNNNSKQEAPLKISVVTVCYNAVTTIEETMLSVLNQTYPNVEYIVIDGGSTDGTVDIIKKYADRLAYWTSEPDKGIYDAMNKGIDAATGDYINFMNSGDKFYDDEVIKKVFAIVYIEDIIYGQTYLITDGFSYLGKNHNIEYLSKNMAFGHQAVFTKKELMKIKMFDTTYKSASDYDFFFKAWKEGASFREIPEIIVRYNAYEGISSTNKELSWREGAIINGDAMRPGWKVKFFLRCLDYNLRRFLKGILPTKLVRKINRYHLKAQLQDV